MATPSSLAVGQEPAAIDTSISTQKHSAKNAPESSAKVMNVVLRVLEGIGLIFANIITFGLINCIPAIHDEYRKVFGGKQVVVKEEAELDTTLQITDPVDTQESTEEGTETTEEQVSATTSQETTASQKLWTLKDGAAQAYQACSKENAQFVFDKTREGVSYGLSHINRENAQFVFDKTKEGVSYGLSHINRENAQKIYNTATNPRNFNKTIGAVGAVAVGVIGMGIYAYSGDSAGAIADMTLNATTV